MKTFLFPLLCTVALAAATTTTATGVATTTATGATTTTAATGTAAAGHVAGKTMEFMPPVGEAGLAMPSAPLSTTPLTSATFPAAIKGEKYSAVLFYSESMASYAQVAAQWKLAVDGVKSSAYAYMPVSVAHVDVSESANAPLREAYSNGVTEPELLLFFNGTLVTRMPVATAQHTELKNFIVTKAEPTIVRLGEERTLQAWLASPGKNAGNMKILALLNENSGTQLTALRTMALKLGGAMQFAHVPTAALFTQAVPSMPMPTPGAVAIRFAGAFRPYTADLTVTALAEFVRDLVTESETVKKNEDTTDKAKEAEKAKQEALEKAKLAAAEKAKQEALEKAKLAAAEKAKQEALEKAKLAAAEKAKQEALEKAKLAAAEKAKQKTTETPKEPEPVANAGEEPKTAVSDVDIERMKEEMLKRKRDREAKGDNKAAGEATKHGSFPSAMGTFSKMDSVMQGQMGALLASAGGKDPKELAAKVDPEKVMAALAWHNMALAAFNGVMSYVFGDGITGALLVVALMIVCFVLLPIGLRLRRRRAMTRWLTNFYLEHEPDCLDRVKGAVDAYMTLSNGMKKLQEDCIRKYVTDRESQPVLMESKKTI